MRASAAAKSSWRAAFKGAASPTSVKTVRLWAASDDVSSRAAPGTPATAAARASITSLRRPSLTLGNRFDQAHAAGIAQTMGFGGGSRCRLVQWPLPWASFPADRVRNTVAFDRRRASSAGFPA